MSDTPPDRKEADDAPEGPRNPWVGWLTWLLLTPVLYVLSAGPVVWLVERDYLPEWPIMIYTPLGYLPHSATEAITRYAKWWRL